MCLQPLVSRVIVTHGGTLVLRACSSFGLDNLMVSRHAARQSNVVWGGIKLCVGGNSQWQVTTVSHRVSSPHRDSLGCGVEREQPCKSASYQTKWHKNNLAPYFWTPKVETQCFHSLKVVLPAFCWPVDNSCNFMQTSSIAIEDRIEYIGNGNLLSCAEHNKVCLNQKYRHNKMCPLHFLKVALPPFVTSFNQRGEKD